MPPPGQHELDLLIPPEIRDDPFAHAIHHIARHEPLRHILEIGSSSGEGSTRAFVEAVRENSSRPILHCMEVSRARFEALRSRYAAEEFVRCYNVSSVPIEAFPSEQQVREFFRARTGHPVDEVLRWLRQDVEYVKQAGVPQDGIDRIRRENSIDRFDLVLIDGSEFTGSAELDLVIDAGYILLDDINSFKNAANFARLFADRRYVLLHHRPDIRNGFAIFKHKDIPVHSYTTIAPAVERIEGFMVSGQEEYLFNKVRSLPADAAILEIGSFKGRSTAAMAFACAGTDRRLFCIDTWDGNDKDFPDRNFYDIWRQNLDRCRLLDCVIGLRGISHDILSRWPELADNTPIDFAFIDGSHQYADVLRDFELAWPIVKDNGWIAFHDVHYTWPGPLRVWHDIARRALINHEYASTLACGQKPAGGALASPAPLRIARERSALPIHFFTLALNAQPFIRHHITQLEKLDFDWHWHIIEGVATLTHDTAWSLATGGRIPSSLHREGRSIDGTSEYLDQLADRFPDRITIYRKPPGEFWDGKLEMVNQPLNSIAEDCLLWQLDADELWTAEQFTRARRLFLENPGKTAAFYWCWFFVGPDRVTSTRNCYANNPAMEWLRTWRYRPGMRWASHEPPVLAEVGPSGQWRPVHAVNPFRHDQTESAGLVFQHFAYATEPQVRFKQDYYGYANAVQRWRALQAAEDLPVPLRDFFPWVQDETQVDRAEEFVAKKLIELPAADLGEYKRSEKPEAGSAKKDTGNWQLATGNSAQSAIGNRQSAIPSPLSPRPAALPRVLIDCVFFQYYNTGIARVWRSLLQEWQRSGLADHFLLLDRAGTAPRIPGLRYAAARAHNYSNLPADRALIDQLLHRHGASVFMSTYYSRPESAMDRSEKREARSEKELSTSPSALSTRHSALLLHDFIPELFSWDLSHPMWREKHDAIRHADALVCVSHSTARDLARFFPEIPPQRITVAPLAAAPAFYPRTTEEVQSLRAATGITRPYFLIVGARGGYKNTILSFRALAQLPNLDQYDLLCAGHATLEPEFQRVVPGLPVRCFHLTDDELAAAYSGAVALLHPSTYEGFGLPVLEALACGCPVITTKNGSLAEVAGDAALYVPDNDPAPMTAAMLQIQDPQTRQQLIEAGLAQAKKFSWETTARIIWERVLEISSR